MDSVEREALRADGIDPDDPTVIAAIDLVRWELSMLLTTPSDYYPHPAARRREPRYDTLL